MIIISLYIYSLKDDALLKQYEFNRYGVNVILGDKAEADEADNKEANGSGKTTMVECLRFLLGGALPGDFQNRPLLAENDIFLALEVEAKDSTVFLGRLINSSSSCFYRKAESVSWDFKNWEARTEEQYKKYLEEFTIGIEINKDTPTFGQLREYLIRDEKHGFGDIPISNRLAIQNYRVLAFLCGLPHNSEKEIMVNKKLQKKQNELLKQIKLLSDDIAELKFKEKRLKYDIDKMSNIIGTLNITEKIEENIISYNDIKRKLSKIQRTIFEYENIIEQYKKNIDNLEEKVKEIKLISNIEPFYQQLIGYFPQKISKNYDEVAQFYDFMVDNRGKYFKSKIGNLNIALKKLIPQRDALQQELDNNSKLINSKDLLGDLTSISEELRQKNEELGQIKYKIELYNKKKDINDEINRIKQEVIILTEKRYDEFKFFEQTINSIQQMFDALMVHAYQETGVLEFEFDNQTGLNDATGRIKIKCRIQDESSHGRLYMKINIFDLSWFLSDASAKIGFLIHDGSYCKPDKEVKFKLLRYVENILSEKQKGQYIITANVDEFEPKAVKYLRNNKLVIAELDRKEGHINRFFGFKY